jgi:cell division protein FtsB
MATPSGWFWIEEYWKLYGEFNKVWRQFQERLAWYDTLYRENEKLTRRVNRLQDQNDQLVAVNRRIMTENQALREGASETRGEVLAECVDKVQSALDKAKAAS